MTAVYLAQLAIPVAIVAWLLAAPPASRVGWLAQVGGSLLALAALSRLGIWLFPPWWTPHLAAALVLLAVPFGWRRRSPMRWLPVGAPGWSVVVLFVAIACGAAYLGARALAGARLEREPVVDLGWPFDRGLYLVANGGSDPLVNAHRVSELAADPRLLPWRGNAWAVDFVAIDRLGFRSAGFRPAEPARYGIFGANVVAPCDGVVVRAVGELPDLEVPRTDRANPAGNHVILACGDVQVVLAHLRRGSVFVAVGDAVARGARLGAVGNSGLSDEPHLHIHAQRPGSAEAALGGDPLPIRFDGRFLVRGDRIELPGRR